MHLLEPCHSACSIVHHLAAHLLIDENPTSASFFQQRYDELKAKLRLGFPAEFEPIEDIYGGLGCGDFARW